MQSTSAAKFFGDSEDPRKRLQTLFGGALPSAVQPPDPSMVWARSVLLSPREGGPRNIDDATRQLREADPRLTFRAATFLATHAFHRVKR